MRNVLESLKMPKKKRNVVFAYTCHIAIIEVERAHVDVNPTRSFPNARLFISLLPDYGDHPEAAQATEKLARFFFSPCVYVFPPTAFDGNNAGGKGRVCVSKTFFCVRTRINEFY